VIYLEVQKSSEQDVEEAAAEVVPNEEVGVGELHLRNKCLDELLLVVGCKDIGSFSLLDEILEVNWVWGAVAQLSNQCHIL